MKPISVQDNLLSPEAQGKVFDLVNGPGLVFGWKSNSKSQGFPYWHKHYAGALGSDHPGATFSEQWDCAKELKELQPMLYQFWQFLEKGVLKGHRLERCYANSYPYGCDGTVHTDSVNPKSFTSIYYPHQRWSPNWAGETVFFNKEESDVIASIYPKPNRLLTFSGVLPHAARGVSRICPANRITLMYKSIAP